MENHEKLTEMQRHHMNSDFEDSEMAQVHQTWFQEDTVDYWRHHRMYATVSPLAKHYKDSTWLSIGDGRYGLDSIRLKKMFQIDVFPTDLSESMLLESKKMGLIDGFGIENAESLSFASGSFDVVFCKEAFHHFSRPIIALYEMIRVAKRAVVLIEPNDSHHLLIDKVRYLTSAVKMLAKKILGKGQVPYLPGACDSSHSFEPSGNYVYSLSARELNKIVHAMDLGGIGYYEFNDAYLEGVEFEKAEPENEVFNEIKRTIKAMDRSGTTKLITAAIFKDPIDTGLKKRMTACGFVFPPRIPNPELADE